MKKTLCLFLIFTIMGGILMTSCEKPVMEPYVLENLRIWPESGTVMTKSEGGHTLTLDENMPEELEFTDWYNATHKEKNPVDRVSLFIDIGFPAPNGKVELKGADCSYKVYASDDGYNFTKFLGEFDTDTFNFNTDCKAFNIVFEKDSVTLSGITVTALPYAKKTLLSVGASYVWEGTGMKAYSDKEGLKLTDGVYFTGDDSVVAAKTAHDEDKLTKKKGNIITLDLGEVKHVSEVSLGAYISGDIKAVLPTRISVRYSADGENWEDFGQSFLVETSGKLSRFTVTRPDTVEARYVKVLTYADGIFATDEIEIWGANTSVARKEYTPPLAIPKGNVNTIKSAGDKALTDGVLNEGVKVEGELSIKAKGAVKGINIVSTAEIKDISPAGKVISNSAAGLHTTLVLLETPVESGEFTLSFECEGEINEIQTFGDTVSLPVVDGGFYQLPTNGGNDVSTQNDAYSWYLSLKGMRDLGMSTVIIQYSTHFNAKTTLINGKNITSAGYTYTPTYGTEDLCKAVLDAAEKLGMKVFIGTIHDADFTKPSQNQAQYDAIVADGEKVIKDIHQMYGTHPAFGGYYLSDETCDYWLNFSGGVEAARKVYEGQSKVIRGLDKDALIMIAPAIWRSGNAAKMEEKLYDLLKPASEGEKPVVDIVAVQDCLGREQTLTVTDKVYSDWLMFCQAWKRGIEKAGADFWHDAEVFEINYSSKRFAETEKSLTLQYPLSDGIIVFDIPHYMTPMALWGKDDWKGVYKMHQMKQYIEYYSKFAQE
ncbi:MAG: DUF4434 domain-containing protein [Clostridia bacterium]|nr:DUF4434 domain-containing protein [Clostridia bacterium]